MLTLRLSIGWTIRPVTRRPGLLPILNDEDVPGPLIMAG
jgi:hypothetical protein